MRALTVDPAELQRTDVLVGQAAAQARAALTQVGAVADDLLDGGWHGPAAAAFRLAWFDWLAGAQAMVAALDAMADVLGDGASGYLAHEDAVRASIVRAGS